MALELNLTKNTNDAIQGTLGKYYARVEYKGTIGLRDLASHMHHHNTAFSKGIINGVLNDMCAAILWYILSIIEAMCHVWCYNDVIELLW